MVSVVESTLDDPRQVLAAMENKARGEAVGQMKADGVEYEERMERLQEISYLKPLEELLWDAYNVDRKSHPWVGDYPVSLKSVIRDMYERALTFTEFTSWSSWRGPRASCCDTWRARTRRSTTPSRTT
ncbi:hypothetical protein STANM309S_01122 [Streptomyces tanashiensis]